MADQTPEKTPVKRIIEVDRKLAAQLYDVWVDMKERIKKDIETLPKPPAQQPSTLSTPSTS